MRLDAFRFFLMNSLYIFFQNISQNVHFWEFGLPKISVWSKIFTIFQQLHQTIISLPTDHHIHRGQWLQLLQWRPQRLRPWQPQQPLILTWWLIEEWQDNSPIAGHVSKIGPATPTFIFFKLNPSTSEFKSLRQARASVFKLGPETWSGLNHIFNPHSIPHTIIL